MVTAYQARSSIHLVKSFDASMAANGIVSGGKKSKKESTQGAVAILKEKKSPGCVSQNSDPKKSILRKAGQRRLNESAGNTIKFSGRTLYEIQIQE